MTWAWRGHRGLFLQLEVLRWAPCHPALLPEQRLEVSKARRPSPLARACVLPALLSWGNVVLPTCGPFGAGAAPSPSCEDLSKAQKTEICLNLQRSMWLWLGPWAWL